MSHLTRRRFASLAAATIGVAAANPTRAATREFRVGVQPYGNLILLKESGLLEKALAPKGWSVSWKRFVSGPPLMEALAAGAIDAGTAGETPPIFAQAAGAAITYLAAEPAAPRGEAILVKEASPIHSLADLKGHTIGLNKGSNVHYFYLRALAKAGLTLQDVQTVFLSPPDGRAAFVRGAIDAWVIWDPFLAAAQAAGGSRVLTDATGLASNHQFYLAARRFAEPEILKLFVGAITAIDAETRQSPAKAASTLSPATGLPESVLSVALARQSWKVGPITPELVRAQQSIADTFFALKLIPRSIQIEDAVVAI
jgi:sulfonate transport system substrate-binding protein